MEWVQNVSDRPIPDPYHFTAAERHELFNLQRRAHLTEYDAKYKKFPLEDKERDRLNFFQARVLQGTLIRFGGVELPFRPFEVYEVPDGFASRIVALNPARLRKLTWEEVRDFSVKPSKVHIQTVEEAKDITLLVAGGDDSALHHGPVAIEMKDGLMRYNDGPWQGIPGGAKLPEV